MGKKVWRGDLYAVELEVGDRNSKTLTKIGIALGLKSALLIKEALAKVLSHDFTVERGDGTIERLVTIDIRPLFRDEIENLVKRDETSFERVF